MKKFLLLLILGLGGLCTAQTDNFISAGSTSPYLTLGRALQWGGTGPGTVGQSFIFNPLDPNQGFCVFFFNNNPTNAHSFTLTVAQSGDPGVKTYFGNTQRWVNVATSTSFPASVSANSVLGINYKTTASAVIVISVTGNALAGGSPDTADIFTVQTNQSSCGTIPVNSVQGPYQQNANATLAQQFPVLIGGVSNPGSTSTVRGLAAGANGGFIWDGVNPNALLGNGFQSTPTSIFLSPTAVQLGTDTTAMAHVYPVCTFGGKGVTGGCIRTNILEMASDMFNIPSNAVPGWTAFGKITNPAAAATLLSQFLAVGAVVNAAYKTLVLSCSAACELAVYKITARGTVCTAITPQNLQIGNNQTQQTLNASDFVENACTGTPTLSTQLYDINLGAGTPFNLDLSGLANFHTGLATGGGLMVQVVTGITGIASASMTFVEQ